MSDQGQIFSRLHPKTYLNRFLDENVRPDGRSFNESRALSINKGSISTASGSSLVRLGNTTIVCGVKAEIAQPNLDRPNEGFLVPNLDLPALCSPRFKPGPPTEEAQALSSKLYDLLIESEILPLGSLCIHPGSAVWCLYVDAICINYDGNPLDAALVAVVAALLNTSLPKTTFNPDTEATVCSRTERIELEVNKDNIPISCSFGAVSERQLSDPSSFEEPLLDSTVTVVLAASKGDSSPRVVSIDQSGELVGAGLDECIELATQSYLRHGPTQAFGLVCSPSSNSVYDGKLAYVPALEDILVWDVKKGLMMAMWHETGHRAQVTCIVRSPQKDNFAVGYADGSIRLWNAPTESVLTTFNGHKKAVTALAFDEQGARLASGSQDTDLIVWDVVAEAGLYRLRGHRDQITAIRFLAPPDSMPSTSAGNHAGMVVTTSKDTFLKLWDLGTQHCIQTLVAHRADVWTMDVDAAEDLLLTGSSEGEVKAWRIDKDAMSVALRQSETGEIPKILEFISSLPLSSKHRVTQISIHPSEPYLAVQCHDRSVEVFRVRTDEEIRKKQLRRKKRAKEKKESGKGAAPVDQDVDLDDGTDQEIALTDRFTPHLVIRASGKIRSFDFSHNENNNAKGLVQIFLALVSNALEVYNIPPPTKSKDVLEASRQYSVDLPGHRTDVRTLCLSSDDQILASASNGTLKIWNMKTTACIRTMDCGYAVCSTFLPGDRHVAVGTKNGEILIFDIASSTLLETISAHSGTVWSLHVRPDEKAIASASADKTVKFWDFETKNATNDNVQSGKIVSLVHIRTLKMTDEVLSVRYSPNQKLLAVALLDSTVKVFYHDTLKFFISLYGHKLPVLSMDISSDSKLLVTSSADKNVKIWGLDFGDCHKSLFAHDESVMQVAFEKDSHYFWTTGKDNMVKYWDGDKFENIQKLDGHHGEIWALALSRHGNFVVTGSHDKSIRVWEKLDEPLFLEEERERELETLYETGIANSLNQTSPLGGGGGDDSGVVSGGAESTTVQKQTSETLMAGEKIMEALDLADNERSALHEYEQMIARMPENDTVKLQPPTRNPLLVAYNLEPEAYVLQVVEKIASTSLHDALLVLPFGKVISLMSYLNIWAQKGWNITLVSRIIFFLLRTHHHQIAANRIMRTSLLPLRTHLRNALRRQKDVLSYNLAALQYLRRRNDSDRIAQFYEEEGMDEEKVRARIADSKKRKRVQINS